MIKRNDTKEADTMQVDNMTQHAGKSKQKGSKAQVLVVLEHAEFILPGCWRRLLHCDPSSKQEGAEEEKHVRPTIGIGTTQVERMTV
jgi:hypothetical protein